VIQAVSALGLHFLAILVYPGLLTVAILGGAAELIWARLSGGTPGWSDLPRRRPTPVIATVALCATLAAVQCAAPFNPLPAEERSAVIAAAALAFTAWAELALTVEHVPEPGVMLVVQFCWLIAVLGPAVQPESLRPQVLGNVLVPALLPVKVACGLLYLLCLPALLRLWPLSAPADRRGRHRIELARALCWFPYCALFTTLFFAPPGPDVAGVARFAGITLGVAAVVMAAGILMERRGAQVARGLYAKVVPPYAALVLVLVVGTSILMR
jgi:hypothetical protein